MENFDQRFLAALEDQNAYLKNIARDIQTLKSELLQIINYMHDAESEVPEKTRRFVMYFHDLHDIKYIYDENGLTVPPYILREMERCDDRFRHITEDNNKAGGVFEKVRRDMTQREGNRWDHTALLPKQETTNETRPSTDSSLGNQSGTEVPWDESGSGSGHWNPTGADPASADASRSWLERTEGVTDKP